MFIQNISNKLHSFSVAYFEIEIERVEYFPPTVFILSQLFTYVRTEVNYTEEVDDPVDSDGKKN